MKRLDLGRVPWTLLTFGGGSWRWRSAAFRLATHARRCTEFDAVSKVTDGDLRNRHPEFWIMHERFLLSSHAGFGYWLWKPYLIWSLLAQMGQQRGGVAYIDAGCEFNLNPLSLRRLHFYLSQAELHGFLGMRLAARVGDWCAPSLLEHYGLTESADRPMVAASTLFVMNTADNRRRMQDWYDECRAGDYAALRPPDAESCVPHRHDQSVLSCLLALDELPTIPDETYFAPDWLQAGHGYPIWAMRNSLPFSVKPGTPGSFARVAATRFRHRQ